LGEYLGNSSPSTLTIPGDPACRLVTDPQRHRIALRTPYDGGPLPTLDLEYVELRVISENETRWYELGVEYSQHPHESYLFLSDISDLLQQESCPFDVAVESVVSTFDELLAHSRSLSREKQVGLFGELLFLISCIRATTVDDAVSAWKGFTGNEHDFVFPSGAFEVKTTTTEARRHRISSLDQLSPLPNTPLWLISVQLTSATPSTGQTLAEMIDEARQLTSDHRELERSLARAGWRERDRATYRTPYRLRSVPVAYRIDDSFPALTRAAVARGCPHPELIIDATYVVDVSGLTHGDPPSPADQFTAR
jgi:Putative  PD-(D/E)XK family member, (DUF4420)